VGWLILPPEVRPYAAKNHQNFTSCATSFAQAGVAEALRNAEGDVKRMIAGYKDRRDAIVARLRSIDGFEIQAPAGAFYAFPQVSELTSRLGLDTAKFAAWLLDEAGVAAVPGDVFHAPGHFLRMAYCRPLEEIHEAMDRIEAAVKKHFW
jgi:aspartate/methionine/tyrosine aminotransferase